MSDTRDALQAALEHCNRLATSLLAAGTRRADDTARHYVVLAALARKRLAELEAVPLLEDDHE